MQLHSVNLLGENTCEGVGICVKFSFTFHSSIIVYPLLLFLSSLIKMKHKSYDIYSSVIILLWLTNSSMDFLEIIHLFSSRVLNMIAVNITFLARYSSYIGNAYNSFTSRKNFLFIIMMLFFTAARPKKNPLYDHWLKFFAFNLAATFPLSTFSVGYRLSDICLGFIISMFIFSLRMTGVH